MQIIQAIEMEPILINCHSGHDSWNDDMALSYFQQVLAVEKELIGNRDIIIVHETHRQRLLYNPFQTYALLQHEQLSELKVNADLSHWVCVCERIFKASDPRDDWWPAVLSLLASHCHLIHARIGYAEGPQIPDPRNSRWSNEVSAHLDWWEHIWMSQSDRGVRRCIVEPEHGPEPYQIYSHICPPLFADGNPEEGVSQYDRDTILRDINNFVAEEVRKRFEKFSQGQSADPLIK
jgi:hypothetical protein